MLARTSGLACILLAFVGCAHTVHGVETKAAPASQLVSSEKLSPDMLLRQHLHGQYGEKKFDFECVLQITQSKLTIIGLTPFGTRAFVLTQDGLTHTFDKMVDREMPFDPVRILEDVHRVYFRALPPGTSDVRTGTQGEERVEEHWRSGILTERTFTRLDGQPKGVIRVTFGGPNDPLVPVHVVIDNGWYGYKLEIDSVVQQSLTGGTP